MPFSGDFKMFNANFEIEFSLEVTSVECQSEISDDCLKSDLATIKAHFHWSIK